MVQPKTPHKERSTEPDQYLQGWVGFFQNEGQTVPDEAENFEPHTIVTIVPNTQEGEALEGASEIWFESTNLYEEQFDPKFERKE